MPLTPYVGMPAARRNRPSVAPVLMVGITGMSPQICRVSDVVTPRSVGSIASGATPNFSRLSTVMLTLIVVSFTTRAMVARTSSSVDVGTMRQFTFTVAVCGSALYACPPFMRVATHDVRSMDA